VTAYSTADWGGFGTTAATAAATLTGLLFIAVSLNLRQILDNGPLPGRAAQTLIFFVIPLIFALLLVVPAQAAAALGAELIATGVLAGAMALVIDYRSGRSEYEPGWSRPLTRVVPMAVSCACIIVAGVTLVAGAGGGLYWLVPAAILAIVAGLVNTWVLLVEIMR
jgi:modulator of FtsH protease